MAGVGCGNVARRDQAHLPLFIDQGVILGNLPGLALAHEVTPRIANVRDHGLVVTQGAGDERGGHTLAAVFGLERAIVHRGIGVLDESRDQADEHGAGLSFGELLSHDRNCGCRGDLSQVEAAHSIGNREEKTVGAGLLARSGDKGAHSVFIVGADFAEVACLAELYVQHVRRRVGHPGQLRRRDALL